MSTLVVAVNFDNHIEIGPFLDELAKFHPPADVVVVDDGSTDGSDRIAAERGFHVLRHGRNRGVGAAIRTGIHYAQAGKRWDSVAIMSCNGKMMPSDLPAMIRALDGADYVQGNRFLPGNRSRVPWDRRLGVTLFSILGAPLLHRWSSDLTCGFRCYRLSLFDDPRMRIDQDWLDRYEMEYFIHFWACRGGARIVEVPVSIHYAHLSRARFTKIPPFRGQWSMYRPLLRLAWSERRPWAERPTLAPTLAAILLLAIAVRIPGLLWGVNLPSWTFHVVQPDETTLTRLAADQRIGLFHERFPYPRAFVRTSAAVMAAARLPAAPLAYGRAGPFLASRAVSLIFGVLTVGLLYLAMRFGLRDRRAAAFGALFLALSPLHVMNSHLGTADAMTTFFDALALVLAMAAVGGGRRGMAFGAAAAGGVALATKLTPFSVAPVVIAGLSLRHRDRRSDGWAWIPLVACAAAAFALANGRTSGSALFQGVMDNARTDNMGVTDAPKWINPLFFLLLLAIGCGAPCSAFAVWAISRWRTLRLSVRAAGALAMVALPAGLIYLAIISNISIPYTRHLLPLVPIVCAMAGLGLSTWVSTRSSAVRRLVVSAVFLYQLLAVGSIEWYFRHDPMDAAGGWLRSHGVRESQVFRPAGSRPSANTAEQASSSEYVLAPETWYHRFERSQINPLGAPDCGARLFHQSTEDCEFYRSLVAGSGFSLAASFNMRPVVLEQALYNRVWGSYAVSVGAVRIYRRVAS